MKKKNSKTIVIALGGNALISPDHREGYSEQLKNAEKIAKEIAQVAKKGYKIVITHGNGPQVGNILLQQEYSKESVPMMPLFICGAQSQGQIGTMLALCINNKLKKQNLKTKAVAVISHALVNPRDPAFSNPDKPIGPIYTPKETEKLKKRGMVLKKIMPGAFRRVAASPLPLKILEIEVIKNLLNQGFIPIVVGGGGIPVIEHSGKLKPTDAVIDKDLSSQVLANQIKADYLIILTNVKKVCINFQKPNQAGLNKLTLAQARKYLKKGEFARGSMKPKIEAAIGFLKQGGKQVIIGHLNDLQKILNKKSGTIITI
jgi:carbamate kinase